MCSLVHQIDMHKNFDGKSDEEFWKSIHTLTDRFPDIKTAAQPHKTYSEFYKDVDSNFEKFAKSRHTLRHYGGSGSEDEIKQAVTLAMTAPSACNRQPVRVHCVCEKTLALTPWILE